VVLRIRRLKAIVNFKELQLQYRLLELTRSFENEEVFLDTLYNIRLMSLNKIEFSMKTKSTARYLQKRQTFKFNLLILLTKHMAIVGTEWAV
jgi:hypothetical protein